MHHLLTSGHFDSDDVSTGHFPRVLCGFESPRHWCADAEVQKRCELRWTSSFLLFGRSRALRQLDLRSNTKPLKQPPRRHDDPDSRLLCAAGGRLLR